MSHAYNVLTFYRIEQVVLHILDVLLAVYNANWTNKSNFGMVKYFNNPLEREGS